ncbi:glyoxalase [Thiohalorhabdus denitrificans]|uniref:VOC domain-containing protein n=1 Tax=Thiohalorhabdus denitrificans TaxID=381306 RepID=A0A0P9GI14_9GAMM|nr:ArsI/CadI family heavy metal resistance metalloenzyme [Thiohalorhabdus denitrificans]KPV39619.1 glyoxalase [Thiohalorhabdus denitrificans]SCX96587.1 hypothetical protein SAMN05661077_0863 [Thiohalorhabdus denitrificans]
MNRFHVHVAVDDLERNKVFYSSLFGAEPAVSKPDYAKWELEDPAVNFAISARGRAPGIDHLGIQAADEDGLSRLEERARAADAGGLKEAGTTCCYAVSDKYWVTDPQGVAWETYHTLDEAALFTEPAGGCCGPETGASSCCD